MQDRGRSAPRTAAPIGQDATGPCIMLDRLFDSPALAFGFILFVFILGGIYLVNRERSHVHRLRGPRRFQPDWGRMRGGERRRRARKRSGFHPGWNPRPDDSASDKDEDG